MDAALRTAPPSPVMRLLGEHLPLTLLVDLVLGGELDEGDLLEPYPSERSRTAVPLPMPAA